MSQYLIIGNGVAGATAAEYIRKNDAAGKITIVTDEPLPFYYRLRLNEYISGDIGLDALIAKRDSWYRDSGIELLLNTRIMAIETEMKHVTTDKGENIPYDRLLIATGSRSFVPSLCGSRTKGVFTIRNTRDAEKIINYCQEVKEVVVIGGGLLGLEAGNTFRKMGKQVTVVESSPRLLPRQLDTEGASRLQAILERMGFFFRLDAKTEAIEDDISVKAVHLFGGELLPAQMVIISAGVRPATELARQAGIACDRGIKINSRMSTNMPDIYAAGDCTEFNSFSYGIWPAAMEQGRIAGANMAGADMVYTGSTMSNYLKVAGVDLASAGNIDAEGRHESKIIRDEEKYQKIVLDSTRVIGCIMLGDTRAFPRVMKLISSKRDASALKEEMLKEDFDLSSI